ncbi:MAG: FecR domain-containing protein [Sedimentisphaerales bacterium]|nr:FecR domain-containing protein [Sedimentisphaerales bacterium]
MMANDTRTGNAKWRRLSPAVGLLVVCGAILVLPSGVPAQDPPANERATQPVAQPVAQPAAQSATANAVALKAIITKVTGKTVQYSPDGGKNWKPAQQGTELGRGALVRTGFGGGCELSFGSHSVLIIQALSSVRVADYLGIQGKEIVRANLQYGALRCGVEKGSIQADTRISTPVSTLSIRGTMVYVSYDAGVRSCMLGVDKDGPAMAQVFSDGCCGDGPTVDWSGGQLGEGRDPNEILMAGGNLYELYEGMRTDCTLSRDLRLAIFDRAVFVTGDYTAGAVSAAESEAYVRQRGVVEPTGGATQFNDDKSVESQKVRIDEVDFPEGDIPIGRRD